MFEAAPHLVMPDLSGVPSEYLLPELCPERDTPWMAVDGITMSRAQRESLFAVKIREYGEKLVHNRGAYPDAVETFFDDTVIDATKWAKALEENKK